VFKIMYNVIFNQRLFFKIIIFVCVLFSASVLASDKDQAIAYQTYISRGNYYARRGQLEKAIEDYKNAIDLSPSDPIAYYMRGNAYREKGLYEKAVEDLTRAIALNIKDPDVYTDLSHIHYKYGDVFRKKGQYNMAIEEYSAAIALTPNNPKPYTGRGYVYILKGDKKSAMIDLKKACDLGDKNGCRILEVLKSNLTP
jgi:tetratricopeptide (TPR) repeat protein